MFRIPPKFMRRAKKRCSSHKFPAFRKQAIGCERQIKRSSTPQHRQINFSSLRKCSLPFFPTVFETTSGSLKSAGGSLSDPRVSGSPCLIHSMSAKLRENNAKILRCYLAMCMQSTFNVIMKTPRRPDMLPLSVLDMRKHCSCCRRLDAYGG